MVDYLDFTEEKLELGYDYGAVGGMRFKTTIIKKGDKQEQRNVDWWLPLGRWQLGERTLYQSDVQGIDEVAQLQEFHSNRKGSKQGFRFKDWSDYKVTNQHLGTADGITTQWQLKKTYFAQNYQTHRPITKPVPGTVKIYLDNVEAIGGWTVDYSTGILTFDVPPIADSIINADFEFDVPVWFESDEFSYILQGYQKNPQTDEVEAIYRLGNLAVQEGRIPLALPWYHLDPLPQEFFATLDLGILNDTVTKNQFDTSKEALASGYVRRDSNLDLPEVTFNLGPKNWNQEEINILLGFFWNCKGRALTFQLKLNGEYFEVRLAEDFLPAKFLVYDPFSNEALFAISQLKLFVIKKLLPPVPSYSLAPIGSPINNNVLNFYPNLVTELNGYPLVLGRYSSSTVGFLKPVLPFEGNFELVVTNFGFSSGLAKVSNFMIRQDAAYTVIRGGSRSNTYTRIVKINRDYSYSSYKVTPGYSNGRYAAWKFAISDDTIYLLGLTAHDQNQPHTLYPNNFPPGFSVRYDRGRDAYPSLYKADGVFQERAFYIRNNYPVQIKTVENNNLINNFEYPTTGNNSVVGATDNFYQNGIYMVDVNFCHPIDLEAPANCNSSEKIRHVAFYERFDNELYFRAAFPYDSKFGGVIGKTTYFKRTLIFNNRYCLLPDNTILDFTEFPELANQTILHIGAGENYLVILTRHNTDYLYRLYLADFV